MKSPLADRLRPKDFPDFVGQKHIINNNSPLQKTILKGEISNLIFYGPPGTGKTTLAEIIAKKTNKNFAKLNGTTAKTEDIKKIIEQSASLLGINGTLIYIDEIQYLNKKQQQTILQFIENGSLTLVASTTENPYFYVYPAIISRSVVFEFLPVEKKEILIAVKRGINILSQDNNTEIIIEDESLDIICSCAMGDVRKSINFIEFAFNSCYNGKNKTTITIEIIKEICNSAKTPYDKDGDSHYNILSAFQKSIRGSDPDGAIHYLARLLQAGDIISPARRLLVIASEDIGLAYPMA
ncbi:MAG: AAA family ATPase, partial [Oscillospiraceae bacterium]